MSERAIPRHSSLLSDLTLEHGPHELLGRFLLKADLAARQRGVQLCFGTLAELVEVNRRNRSSWLPLVSTFDPSVGGITSENSICVLGRDPSGEVVTTQSVRLFQWQGKTFADAARDLTLFYDDPATARLPGEHCLVTAEAAQRVGGRVTITGAGWCRPDYRGTFMTAIFPRVTRAVALTTWAPDHLTCVMSDKVVAGGLADRAGWKQAHWDIRMVGSPIGNLRLGFFTMTADEFLHDLGEFLDGFDVGEVAAVEGRRA